MATLPQGRLALTITRVVDEGIHEDLDVANYSLDPVRFHLEIALRSDFADLFEVKNTGLPAGAISAPNGIGGR